jgi:pSer/pThr/pTyr-binding forkhead associated (FHA) protein
MLLLEVVPEDGSSFEHALEGESLIIGRSKGADLVIPGRGISRNHARLFYLEGELLLEDLSSRNGTRLNGSSCPARCGFTPAI